MRTARRPNLRRLARNNSETLAVIRARLACRLAGPARARSERVNFRVGDVPPPSSIYLRTVRACLKQYRVVPATCSVTRASSAGMSGENWFGGRTIIPVRAPFGYDLFYTVHPQLIGHFSSTLENRFELQKKKRIQITNGLVEFLKYNRIDQIDL